MLPEQERAKRVEILFGEILAENFPNLANKIDIQIQKAQRAANKRKQRHTTWHIIINMSKVKDEERLLKTARGKKSLVIYKGSPKDHQQNFQQKLCRLEERGTIYLKCWRGRGKKKKKKPCQLRILYSARLSFRIKREIKFSRQKVKEFITLNWP